MNINGTEMKEVPAAEGEDWRPYGQLRFLRTATRKTLQQVWVNPSKKTYCWRGIPEEEGLKE